MVLLFSIESLKEVEGDEGKKKEIKIFMVVAIVVYRQSIEETKSLEGKIDQQSKKAHFSILLFFHTSKMFQ